MGFVAMLHMAVDFSTAAVVEDLLPEKVKNDALSKQTVSSPLYYSHSCVTVLFMDVVGFTPLVGSLPPHRTARFLHDVFCVLDDISKAHQVYKVETVGDCYVACAGLGEIVNEFPGVYDTQADRVVDFAFRARNALARMSDPRGKPVCMRIGIHTGPIMSGVVGNIRRRFCLFGDTINVASRRSPRARTEASRSPTPSTGGWARSPTSPLSGTSPTWTSRARVTWRCTETIPTTATATAARRSPEVRSAIAGGRPPPPRTT